MSLLNNKNQGIALVEIIIGTSILTIIMAFISATVVLFLDTSGLALEQTKALYLAEEGQEFLRYLRDEDWDTIDNLTEGNTYYLSIATTTVALTGTPEIIDGVFTRSVVIDELERDNDDDIVSSGGTADPGARTVTVTVSWGSKDVTLTSVLTNLYNI